MAIETRLAPLENVNFSIGEINRDDEAAVELPIEMREHKALRNT